MKKLSKKMISILLSVLMVVTAIPLGAFTAQAVVSWTPIASSDFTQATIGSASDSGSTSNYPVSTPTYNNLGSSMGWTALTWDDSGALSRSDDGSVYVPDGYMYLSGYSGGCVPITGQGAQGWKLDLGFRFLHHKQRRR